jgi:FecR protein
MRFLCYVCCAAVVVAVALEFAQKATQAEEQVPDVPAGLNSPTTPPAPMRVGRVSFVSGDVNFRNSDEVSWVDAALNLPVFTGEALRTAAKARAEIQIGANTVALSNGTEIEIAKLGEHVTQISLARGRIDLDLRHVDDADTIEIDFPGGGVWPLGPGRYDINLPTDDQPTQVAVFSGRAHYVRADGEGDIEGGRMLVLAGSDVAASVEPAKPDEFVAWCRGRDYDETRLAATYYVSPQMTGFAELDTAGIWKINSQYGPVWFPTASEEWAPYRFGHWSWIPPWGWTWIDEQPWGFAPSHFGRWMLIDEHWAWIPGTATEEPGYTPAAVAFLGTAGVGLSSEDGAAVAWFPLAPGEVYWPRYTRDLGYVRDLNRGSVSDVETIDMPADGEPPLEVFNKDFANRLFATVVPRSVFLKGGPVAPARFTLPEQRLRDAPVLMGSPQIAPLSPQRVARVATPPVSPMTLTLSRRGGAKAVHTVSLQLHGRGQPIIIRGAHLHAPAYAGQARGRQTIMLHVAHLHNGHSSVGKRARS